MAQSTMTIQPAEGVGHSTTHSRQANGVAGAGNGGNGNGNGGGGAVRPLRHVLDFEKPLAQLEQQIVELEALQASKQTDYSRELRQLRTNYTSLLRKTYDSLSPWETVQVARHPQRPLFLDYVQMVCREFRELHGDRQF